MAFGEVGGPVSSLVLTCRTPGTGTVDIHRGDAVKLSGAYEISNVFETGDRIFGQALADLRRNLDPVDDDLDRVPLALVQPGQVSVLHTIFAGAQGEELLVRWLADEQHDPAVQEKGAEPELLKLIAARLELQSR